MLTLKRNRTCCAWPFSSINLIYLCPHYAIKSEPSSGELSYLDEKPDPMLLPLQLPAFAVQEAEGAEGAPRGFGRLEERLHRHQGELLPNSNIQFTKNSIESCMPSWTRLKNMFWLLPTWRLLNPLVPGDFFSRISLPKLVERCIAWIETEI